MEAANHPNIELMTYSEVTGIEGSIGNYTVKVNKKARFVDLDKCTGCGACVTACPRDLIELVSAKKRVHILCSSHDKGVEAKKRCGNKTACINCSLCVKKCPKDAISMQENLAVIDYDKCINCGMCADVCPTGAIFDPLKEVRAQKKAAAKAKAEAAKKKLEEQNKDTEVKKES